MPAEPLPSVAGSTLTALTGTRAQQISEITDYIDANYGSALAQEWETYASGEPATYSVPDLYGAFLLTGVGGQLAKTAGSAVQAQAGATGQIAAGTVAGLDAAEKTLSGGVLGFLSNLASANLWERIGEVVLGLLLIGVGVAKISGAAGAALGKVPVAGSVIGAAA